MSNKSVDISQAIEMILKEDVLLLDTRDAHSFATQALPKAKNITPDNAAQILLDCKKEQTIVVYCYHGISSLGWVEALTREGFSNVYNLQGGFSAWQQADGELQLQKALAN